MAASKCYLFMGVTECCAYHRYQFIHPVRGHVDAESISGIGIRLKRNCSRSANLRCKHGVASDIRADINKQVSGPKKVKYKTHISKFVKAAIDITGGARHPALHYEFRAFDP